MDRSVRIAADDADFVETAARLLFESAERSIRDRGRFTVALSGGTTPRRLFAHLTGSAWRERFPWAATHVFFGDERGVPPESPDSNYHSAAETLLSKVPIPASQIHRMEGERPVGEAARRYEELLRRELGSDEDPPRIDFVMLGIGEDGHTASLFPGTAALEETHRWVIGHRVDHSISNRITFTFPLINRGRRVVFLVQGESKAAVLAEIMDGKGRFPAERVRPDGELIWLLGREAAQQLPAAERERAART